MDFGIGLFTIVATLALLYYATRSNKKINVERESRPIEPSESSKPPPTNPNLINCPDCYKEVSKNADICIHCGCNLRLGHNKTAQALNKASRGMKKTGCSIMIFQLALAWCIMIGILIWLLWA